MKKLNDLLESSIEFEKIAQSPYDDPDDPYDDPMSSREAHGEVRRINGLISKIKNNMSVFMDAVSNDEDIYDPDTPEEKMQEKRRRTMMARLINKLSGVGRQWITDIGQYGVSFKTSEKYVSYMHGLIDQIKNIKSPRGEEHKKLLEPLTSALWDYNPSQVYRGKKPATKKPPKQQYKEYVDKPREGYSFYPWGGKSGG